MMQARPAYPAILIIILLMNTPALASGFLMGRIVSVNPSGAEDAGRNPALLALQPDYNAIGVSANYRKDASTSISQRELSLSLATLDVESSYQFSTRLSYARRLDLFVVGIATSNSLETTGIQQRAVFQTPSLTLGKGSIEIRDRVHAGTLSLAVRLGPSHSLGVRADVTYQNKGEINRSKAIITLPLMFFREYSTTFDEDVIVSPAIGYHFRTDNSGIGIIVSPGKPAWNRKEKKSERIIFTPSPDVEFKGRGKLPFLFNYSTGPGITAGIYWKRPYSTGMGLEFDLTSPIRFDDHALVEIGKLLLVRSGAMGITNRVSVNANVSLRGGMELHVSPTTLLSLGCGLNHGGLEARVKDGNPFSPQFMGELIIERTSLILYGSWGFDFLLGPSHTLTLGAGVTHAAVENKQSLKHPTQTLNQKVLTFKSKFKILSVEFMTAASFAF